MIEDTETEQEVGRASSGGRTSGKDLCTVLVPGCSTVWGSSVGPRFPTRFSPCKWAWPRAPSPVTSLWGHCDGLGKAPRLSELSIFPSGKRIVLAQLLGPVKSLTASSRVVRENAVLVTVRKKGRVWWETQQGLPGADIFKVGAANTHERLPAQAKNQTLDAAAHVWEM